MRKVVCFHYPFWLAPGINAIYNLMAHHTSIQTCKYHKVPWFVLSRKLFQHFNYQGSYRVVTGYSRRKVSNLSDCEVMVRGNELSMFAAIDCVESLGGTSFVSKEDLEKIRHWPDFVLDEYKGRRIRIVKAKDLSKVIDHYTRSGAVFVKTLIKSYHGRGIVMNKEDAALCLEAGLPYQCYLRTKRRKRVSPNTKLLVSEPASFSSETIRVWVINSETVSMQLIGIPSKLSINQKFIDFAVMHRDKLPKNYVVDFVWDQSMGDYVVEELNTPIAASCYPHSKIDEVVRAFKKAPAPRTN